MQNYMYIYKISQTNKIFRFYRQFILFYFYFVLSLISFTLRPGPQTDENTNDTLTTNSFNVTNMESVILKSLQSSDLSELVTNSFTAAFTSNLVSSLNVTQESFERIQLQVTSNITSALRSMLLLTLSNNNEDLLSSPDEAAIHTLWYTNSPQNASDYFTNMYNNTVIIDANSTAKTTIDDVTPLEEFNDQDKWYVEYKK